MRQEQEKTRKTSDYVAKRLELEAGGVELYIEADYEAWYNQPREIREGLADSVQYYHQKLGIIILGPKNIVAGNRILMEAGYKSEDFKRFWTD